MKYKDAQEGEWIQPIRKGYKMICCDCGLVHKLDFRIVEVGQKKYIEFRAWHDHRSTGQTRRYLNK